MDTFITILACFFHPTHPTNFSPPAIHFSLLFQSAYESKIGSLMRHYFVMPIITCVYLASGYGSSYLLLTADYFLPSQSRTAADPFTSSTKYSAPISSPTLEPRNCGNLSTPTFHVRLPSSTPRHPSQCTHIVNFTNF